MNEYDVRFYLHGGAHLHGHVTTETSKTDLLTEIEGSVRDYGDMWYSLEEWGSSSHVMRSMIVAIVVVDSVPCHKVESATA